MLGHTGLHFSHRMFATECSDVEEEPPSSPDEEPGASGGSHASRDDNDDAANKPRGRPVGWTRSCGLSYTEYREQHLKQLKRGQMRNSLSTALPTASPTALPTASPTASPTVPQECPECPDCIPGSGKEKGPHLRKRGQQGVVPEGVLPEGVARRKKMKGKTEGAARAQASAEEELSIPLPIFNQETTRLRAENDRLRERLMDEVCEKKEALWRELGATKDIADAQQRIQNLEDKLQILVGMRDEAEKHYNDERSRANYQQLRADEEKVRADEEKVRADKLQEERTCRVCMEEPSNMVGMCGHLCLCETCSEQVRGCPICRCARNVSDYRSFFRRVYQS